MAGADPIHVSREIYQLLVAAAAAPAPAVRAWNGQRWGPADAAVTLVLNHPGALRAMLWPPNDLSAGEAYIYDDIDVEGDIEAGLRFVAAVQPRRRDSVRLLRLLRQLPTESRRQQATRPRFDGRLHSLRRDRRAVRHHYDTGNEFFRQFLDPNLVYSCAYFLGPDDTLAEAQVRKLDLICRKLGLRPGQRLLDVGCGWGGLLLHAARHYEVEALGVTLSSEQADYARHAAKEEGLENRVNVLERDYREVAGRFDAIASIGMFEHVGGDQLGVYFRRLERLLAPGGTILNHGITTRDRARRRRRSTFVSTYVFPDGELVPVETVIGQAERSGLEVRDAESIRAHYAATLRHWVANLEANREQAVAAAGEDVYRIWRAYMAGSVVAFDTAGISVYQLILNRPDGPWRAGRSWAVAADDGSQHQEPQLLA